MDKIVVLLVEDEKGLAMVIKETLATRGFDVFWAANGVEGWSLLNSCRPDVCIVDVMMPRKDGFSLVEDIRKVNSDLPIIFLTAMTRSEDVIKGLELGADDYMKKPFSMEELILRIRNLTRRVSRIVPITGPVSNATIGLFEFRYTRLQLADGDSVIQLSQREADLLQMLLERKNELLERRTALLKIWGEDNFFNARSMDVFITRLRKYLQGDPRIQILNVRGKGYKLVE